MLGGVEMNPDARCGELEGNPLIHWVAIALVFCTLGRLSEEKLGTPSGDNIDSESIAH